MNSLKLWIKSFKEKAKSRTPTLNPRINTQEKFQIKFNEFEKKLKEISAKKLDENVEKNPFKQKISLPAFEIQENIEKDTDFKELKTPNFVRIKEKNSRILLKKDQKYSNLDKFSEKLQEISVKSFSRLSTSEKPEETPSFLSFDKLALNAIISA